MKYTSDERKELLLHWWNHCGMREDTTSEFEEFKEILDSDLDFAWNMMLVASSLEESNHRFVMAIRDENLDIYKKFVDRVTSSVEWKKIKNNVEELLVNKFVIFC